MSADQDHDSPPVDDAPPAPSCGGCRSYQPRPSLMGEDGPVPADNGRCLRYAPRLVDEEQYGIWPRVLKGEICGEFEWADEPESEYARESRERSRQFDRALNRGFHGPALPPRECPCDGMKLRPGQKAHLASCKMQYLGTEEGYARSLAGLYTRCHEPECSDPALKTSMLCQPHGGVPLAEVLGEYSACGPVLLGA